MGSARRWSAKPNRSSGIAATNRSALRRQRTILARAACMNGLDLRSLPRTPGAGTTSITRVVHGRLWSLAGYWTKTFTNWGKSLLVRPVSHHTHHSAQGAHE